MDRVFMKEFYKNCYSYPQEIAIKDSEEYIEKRNLRYEIEAQFVELLNKSGEELEQMFEKYLDACADEEEILMEEMYLLGANDREKMLR